MIERIDHLKAIGRFAEFPPNAALEPFNKVNLIFGYNGSGKTTLTNVFRLYSKEIPLGNTALFSELSTSPDAEVSLVIDGRRIDYGPQCERKPIYVFNDGFVGDHVYNGSSLMCRSFDSAVVTSEQLKNPAIERLDSKIAGCKTQLESINTDLTKLDATFRSIRDEHAAEFNAHIRGSRMPSVNVPSKVGDKSADELRGLLDGVYASYARSLKQEELRADLENLRTLSFDDLKADVKEIHLLLARAIAAHARDKIQSQMADYSSVRLARYRLVDWFEDGYLLLQRAVSTTKLCPLCRSSLIGVLDQLTSDYAAYFSEELRSLNDALSAAIDTIDRDVECIKRNKVSSDSVRAIASRNEVSLEAPLSVANEIESHYKDYLLRAKAALLEKREHIDKVDIRIVGDALDLDDYYEWAEGEARFREAVLKVLEAQSLNPDKIVAEVKKLVEALIYARFDGGAAANHIESYKALNVARREKEAEQSALQDARNREVAKLRDESKYVNRFLKRLGINTFELLFDEVDSQRQIFIVFNKGGLRRTRLRNSLSESEKTSLAFAYFLSKIEYEVVENSTAKLEDTVIVIDDPVSSLDENRLFTTAQIIWEKFESSNQMFVFSHNISFMKFLNNLVGDYSDGSGESKVHLRRDYYISSSIARLEPLPSELRNYRTTYFHKLECLRQFSDGEITYEMVKGFLPNYIRTTLETFLGFKLCVLRDAGSGGKYLAPGMKRLINALRDRSALYDHYPKVGSIDSSTIVATLEHLKEITDAQVHGSPTDMDEIVYISEIELKAAVKSVFDIVGFLDTVHFAAVTA